MSCAPYTDWLQTLSMAFAGPSRAQTVIARSPSIAQPRRPSRADAVLVGSPPPYLGYVGLGDKLAEGNSQNSRAPELSVLCTYVMRRRNSHVLSTWRHGLRAGLHPRTIPPHYRSRRLDHRRAPGRRGKHSKQEREAAWNTGTRSGQQGTLQSGEKSSGKCSRTSRQNACPGMARVFDLE